MADTINGKPAGCDVCAFNKNVDRIELDLSKPVGKTTGTRRVVVLLEDGKTTEERDEPREYVTRPIKTVSEPKCCADREPADFPAARICARFAAK